MKIQARDVNVVRYAADRIIGAYYAKQDSGELPPVASGIVNPGTYAKCLRIMRDTEPLAETIGKTRDAVTAKLRGEDGSLDESKMDEEMQKAISGLGTVNVPSFSQDEIDGLGERGFYPDHLTNLGLSIVIDFGE